MKRFISLLSLALMLASNVALTANAATTYTGVDESNAFSDYVAYASASGTLFERTTAASNSIPTSDIRIGKDADEALYFGYDQMFEGVSMDIGTAATGGKYIVEYWNGSSWATVISETTANFENNSSTGVFSLSWDWGDIPTWAKTTLNVAFNEEGSSSSSSPEVTDSLYYVRLRLTSGYSAIAKADQVGILKYNAVFLALQSELGTDLTLSESSVSFASSTGDTTIYDSIDMGDGAYGYALYTPSSTAYTYTINVSGYVEESADVTLSKEGTGFIETIDFAQVLVARDPDTANEVTIDSAKAGTSSTTCTISSKRAYCPVPASQDAANGTVYADGYAPTAVALSNRALDTDAQATNYMDLNYAYLATVKDQSGNYISDATVEMGDSSYSIDCEYVSNGQYGCVVPTSNDLGKIRISGDNFDTETTAFSTARDSNSDSQVSQTFTIDEDVECGSSCSDDDEADLDVVSMDWEDDGDFVFTLENIGDEDVDEDENVYVAIYVDGDREYYEDFSNESGDDFLDAGEEDSFNLGNDFLEDEDEEYEVKICVDYTDTVDESSESNNCLTEDLEIDSDDEDGIDLEIEDMYVDDEDLIFEIANNGDEDVDDNESVKIYVYVDETLEYTLVVDGDDEDEAEFFEAGESVKFNVGDNVFDDHGNTYDVEVCVDVGNSVEETEEDNNCLEEDEDELEEGADNNDNDCEDFVDVDGHWGEEYICNLFDLEVVEGYNQYYFGPDYDVTRAEFLKMALLAFDKDVEDADGNYYNDVSSSAWYYEYVSYATEEDYVEGYADGNFRPNDDISRSEALVILLRIAGQDDTEGDNIDSDDIDFDDVDDSDWFAWAVVVADEDNIVDGYSNGDFGPSNDLSRAEAAKIIDLATEEY
ncbi:MAG: S-layer homology domain-containing protein [Patescibacteria group bacterium]